MFGSRCQLFDHGQIQVRSDIIVGVVVVSEEGEKVEDNSGVRVRARISDLDARINDGFLRYFRGY